MRQLRRRLARALPLFAALSIATALTTSIAAADKRPVIGGGPIIKKPCEPPECGKQSQEAVVQTPCDHPDCGEVQKPRPPLVVAGDPDPEPPYPRAEPVDYWMDGAGPRLTFGRAITEGLADGYYGRFESEYFEARDVLIGGALLGLEGWGGPDGGGGAIPISVYWGVRAPLFTGPKAPSLFLSIGLGFNCVIIDYVKDEGGFGLFSPFGTGVAGFEIFPGGRVLFDARAEYRWQWLAPDRYQFRMGISLAVNSDWWDSSSGGP